MRISTAESNGTNEKAASQPMCEEYLRGMIFCTRTLDHAGDHFDYAAQVIWPASPANADPQEQS